MHLISVSLLSQLLLPSECRPLPGSQTMQPASSSRMLRLGRGLRNCKVGDWGGEGVTGGERGKEGLVLGRVIGIRGDIWKGEGVEGVEGRTIEGES